MTQLFDQTLYYFLTLVTSHQFSLLRYFSAVIVIEMPFYAIIMLGIIRHYFVQYHTAPKREPYYPKVSCVVVCYNEGDEIKATLISLMEQIYRGRIEILVAIDPAGNDDTRRAAEDIKASYHHPYKEIKIQILEKLTRGGHASSMNLGLAMATGDIIISIDGDCSVDNDMVERIAEQFTDANVIGVSGTLRVRNLKDSIWTRFQSLEYMFGIQLGRIGMGQLNIMNNISGAFGAFRRKFLSKIGGWNNGTAEDLDLTFRIHSYFRRFKQLKMVSAPKAVLHTDAPNTLMELLKQRLRWDGDLFYIYCRRHWRSFSPRFLGWKGFIGILWYGLLFQIALPMLLLCYLTYAFYVYNLAMLLALLAIGYCYYLVVLCLFYIVHITLVSERRRVDLGLMPYLFLMPIYQLFMRLFTGYSVIYEIIMQSHKDTSMAPWHVIKKTK
ncbi:MAG: hypothetical protein COB66_05930 [Coxiella sp. (in: Bacteria)]|nr:MAG: hypothetical protein COB66_05930 [Coxiella sp. (in: g-proteobacteria)]